MTVDMKSNRDRYMAKDVGGNFIVGDKEPVIYRGKNSFAARRNPPDAQVDASHRVKVNCRGVIRY